MIDKSTKLYVFHDDNTVFSDYSNQAADYLRDNFSITLSSTEDYIYIGFDREFAAVYTELVTPNTNVGSFDAKYWDGSGWTVLSIQDESKNWTRSGFWFWSKPEDWEVNTVDSQEAYWIRVRPSVDHSATTIRGINLVFSDDNAMKAEFFEIDNSNILPPGESSHISSHVAARNAIIQRLRNLDYIQYNDENQRVNITQWDLLDIFEIREAATHLALAKVFFSLSDSEDDHWWKKYREYQDKYEEAFKLARLSLDSNSDGKTDEAEVLNQKKPFRFAR